jgi:hypothetical protein
MLLVSPIGVGLGCCLIQPCILGHLATLDLYLILEIKTITLNATISTLCVTTLCILSQPASAVIFGKKDDPSLRLVWACEFNLFQFNSSKECIDRGYPKNFFAWTPQVPNPVVWLWDPPGNGITSISLSFQYDTAKWTPIIGSEGFFCSYTTAGNCPNTSPGVGTSPIEPLPPIDIQPGLPIGYYTIDYGLGSVSLKVHFDTPITSISEEVFFGMKMRPTFDLTNKVITYSEEDVSSGYDYRVNSFTCTTLDGINQCGSNNPTKVMIIKSVPEPTSTLSLLALGTLGAASTLKRKLKSSQSTEKETTKIG